MAFNLLKNKSNTYTERIEQSSFSFRQYAWKQFKKNKAAFFSFVFLILLILLAVFAPLLSNDKPLYCIYKNNKLYPAFSFREVYTLETNSGTETINTQTFDWKHAAYEKVIWAWSAYKPGKSDIQNPAVSPGGEQFFINSGGELIQCPKKFRHRLGTTKDGGDLFAGLLHGIKYSLLIGILSMFIASMIGISLGAMAGYFGDNRFRTKRGVFIMTIAGIFFAWFYGFAVRNFNLQDAFENGGSELILQLFFSVLIFIAVLTVFYLLGKIISRFPFFNKEISLPLDNLVSRIIEIINSLPLFLIILSIAAIARPSFTTLVLIIGLSNWTGIARLTRAEFLKISRLEYIQAARALGLRNRSIILRHALPNALGPALVAIAFGIAGAVLTESGLSFLGVGVPPEITTWGKLLSGAREITGAWWLVLFPGIAIFITVTIYNLIGEGLREALDTRLKK